MHKSVINIDWLALHVELDKLFSDYTERLNTYYKLEMHPYGTRFYKHVVDVSRDKELCFTICYEPYSPILKERGISIKVSNRQLYSNILWDELGRFTALLNRKLDDLIVTRCDICADFNYFSNGMLPCVVVEQLAKQNFARVGKGKFALYGLQTSAGHIYNGIRFGAHGSESSIYLYNKSLELKEKVYKPYIVERWQEHQLDCGHVWRLEISLNPTTCDFFDRLTGDTFKLDCILLRDNLQAFYLMLANKYFRIYDKSQQTDTNVSRKKCLNLLSWVYIRATNISPLRKVSNHSTYDKGVINYLGKFMNEKLTEDADNIINHKDILYKAACVIRRCLDIH